MGNSTEEQKNMTIQEILKELEFNYGTFPRSAIEEAMDKKEQITPELLEILRMAKSDLQRLVEQERYFAYFYALYLLAYFREERAYPLIVDFFSIPGRITMDLTGDLVTEDLGRILASVCHGDLSLMKKLAEDKNANEYVRSAALMGMLVLVALREKPRDEIMAYYQELYRGKLKREPSYVWNGLVTCSTALYPEEVIEDIKLAFKEDLVEEFYISIDWVTEHLALGKERTLSKLRLNNRHRFIGDVVEEMEWWACFPDSRPRRVVKKTTKIGRNDPCPCGSDKKYKWCCGSQQRSR
ncbi:MAG: DUF1186 domain-containing protein [Chloroflexota bacterium]